MIRANSTSVCLTSTMDDYTASTYGDRIAGLYDELYEEPPPSSQLDLLESLARGGRALELGIGTGRLALPLAARGVAVTGLDSSPAMVERLRAKDGGTDIPVLIGDFTHFDLDERFDLVFVAFNTFFGLLTQEDQLECFASVERHLTPDGVFLIEAFVPDPARFDRGQRTSVGRLELGRTVIDVARHSPANQRVDSQHVVIEDGRPARVVPVSLRYAWPAELDLMARLAGLRLQNRWGDWDRTPFGDGSVKHVSIWRR